MKNRIAIFAHHDKDNIIDDYVIYYLCALKEIAKKIIFVSDRDLSIEEQSKLQNIADKVIARKHGEYDFGSYKRGFLFALRKELLNNIDECIFANDSCYGPFNSLAPVFKKMGKEDYDFWGMTQNQAGLVKKNNKYSACRRPHLQSYFLVFKKEVFLSNIFIEFIKSIQKEDRRQEVIIKYEIGLSEKLSEAGFKKGSFINAYSQSNNPIVDKWENLLLKYKMPFLKCSLPRLANIQCITFEEYEKIIKQISDYPAELIHKNIVRTSSNYDFLPFIAAFLKPFFYRIIYYIKKKFKNTKYEVQE